MSNHEIGHAMDMVIKNILDLYDKGELSSSTAKKLIKKSLDVVYGYDGNSYEALESMTYTHCSKCLKKYGKNEVFVMEEDANECIRDKDKVDWEWWYKGTKEADCIGDSLCVDCFRKIFKDILSEDTVEHILQDAKKNSPNREYIPSYIDW